MALTQELARLCVDPGGYIGGFGGILDQANTFTNGTL